MTIWKECTALLNLKGMRKNSKNAYKVVMRIFMMFYRDLAIVSDDFQIGGSRVIAVLSWIWGHRVVM